MTVYAVDYPVERTREVACLRCFRKVEVRVPQSRSRPFGDRALDLYRVTRKLHPEWRFVRSPDGIAVLCPGCADVVIEPGSGFRLRPGFESVLLKPETTLFFGIPDPWWEDAHWLCGNGHVSKVYLNREVGGPACLECSKPVRMCPPTLTEGEEANRFLNGETDWGAVDVEDG